MKPIPSIGTLKMESIGEVRFDLDLDFKGQKRSKHNKSNMANFGTNKQALD